MTIFDKITNIHDRIKKTNEKIEFMQFKADSPRASVFSDTPKGGRNAGNPIEQDYIKKEETEEKLTELYKKLHGLWNEAEKQMHTANIDEQTTHMMKLRFLKCMPWEKCAKTMNETYPQNKWNTNKCFRKYRDVLYRIRRLNRQCS